MLRNRLHETLQYLWEKDGFVHELSHDLNTWLTQVDVEIANVEVKKRFLLDNGGLSVLIVVFKRIAKKAEHERPSLARLSVYAKALSAWASTLSRRMLRRSRRGRQAKEAEPRSRISRFLL